MQKDGYCSLQLCEDEFPSSVAGIFDRLTLTLSGCCRLETTRVLNSVVLLALLLSRQRLVVKFGGKAPNWKVLTT